MTARDEVADQQPDEISIAEDNGAVTDEEEPANPEEVILLPGTQPETPAENQVFPELVSAEAFSEFVGEVEEIQAPSSPSYSSAETVTPSLAIEEVLSPQIPDTTPPPEDAAEMTYQAAPPSFAPIDDEAREPTPTKSRWQQLKDTIQGFIKKVFG